MWPKKQKKYFKDSALPSDLAPLYFILSSSRYIMYSITHLEFYFH